jgi:MFS family permease
MLGGVLTLAATLAIIGVATNLALIRGLLVLAGAGWALIIVNALPMVLDSAPLDGLEQIGIYTGIYFLATQSAEVIGPVLVGGFLDLTGRNYRFIFAYTLVVLAVALAMLLVVRRGEARVLAEQPTLEGA